MNLLDENITIGQHVRLQNWRIPCHHIGYDEARKGIQDDEIASLLRHRHNVTFFTQDSDFSLKRLGHPNCCIVLLNIPEEQTAEYIRKFLRHRAFQTQAQRTEIVARVSHNEIHLWRINAQAEETIHW